MARMLLYRGEPIAIASGRRIDKNKFMLDQIQGVNPKYSTNEHDWWNIHHHFLDGIDMPKVFVESFGEIIAPLGYTTLRMVSSTQYELGIRGRIPRHKQAEYAAVGRKYDAIAKRMNFTLTTDEQGKATWQKSIADIAADR